MRAQLYTRLPAATCRLMLACTTLLVLAACQQSKDTGAQQGDTEMAWARAALQRNSNLEIVATDTQAGVFTVRDRRTGEVHAVKLNELAAAPIAQLTAPAPTLVAQAPTESVGATPTAPEEPAPQTEAQPSTAPSDASTPIPEAKDYTIERSDGQIKVSGPGVSIVSAGNSAPASAKGEPGQRTVDPIICEGQRMIHFDGRSIYVDGDAITARDGCELYITNSRIVASGTGVVVSNAIVHVANSYIEGATAFDAEGGAKMYLRGSTFQGLSRRDALAMIQDQGENQWR